MSTGIDSVTPSRLGERELDDARADDARRAQDRVVIRTLRSGERDVLLRIFEQLGAQCRLQRLLAHTPVIFERDRSILSRVDGWNNVGVMAIADLPARPVGPAHYVRSQDPPSPRRRSMWSTSGRTAGSDGC